MYITWGGVGLFPTCFVAFLNGQKVNSEETVRTSLIHNLSGSAFEECSLIQVVGRELPT